MNEIITFEETQISQLQKSCKKQGYSLGVLRFWYQQQRSDIDRASFQKLGKRQAKQFKIQKRQRLEDLTVEGVVGVITGPVVFVAVFQ
jgi:hypothetical protein